MNHAATPGPEVMDGSRLRRNSQVSERMPRRILIPLSLALLVSSAGPAPAGTVRGTVWMNRRAPAAAKTTTEPTVIARLQRGVSESVIYIEKVPEAVERKLTGRGGFVLFRRAPKLWVPRIVQRSRAFNPRVLAIPAGTAVEFQNLDRVYHNAFSVSTARRFDLGKYAPGKTDTVKFERAGVINLHCDIHPEMLGFIVVTPNHAYTRADSVGRFALPKLPPGPYTVRVWHPRRGEIRRAIDMPRRGDVALDLTF